MSETKLHKDKTFRNICFPLTCFWETEISFFLSEAPVLIKFYQDTFLIYSIDVTVMHMISSSKCVNMAIKVSALVFHLSQKPTLTF